MKKLVYLFVFLWLLASTVFWDCVDNSSYTQALLNSKKSSLQSALHSSSWSSSSSAATNAIAQLSEEIRQLESQLQVDTAQYQSCTKSISYSVNTVSNVWKIEKCSNNLKLYNYGEAVTCYEEYIKTHGEFDNFYPLAKDGLFFAYYWYAWEFLKTNTYNINFALFYYKEAYNIASDSEKRKIADSMITYVNWFLEYQKAKEAPIPVKIEKKAPEIKIENTSSDEDLLASLGIIKNQDNKEAYNLGSNVLRQEVVWVAAKLGRLSLPDNYTCRNIFVDVSISKPNSWICRAVEIAADNSIVSTANKSFRPEWNITRVEALAILLKSAWIGIDISSGASKYADVTEQWQINVVNTALKYDFVDSSYSFYPNKEATRGEIFNMARRISDSKN